MSNNSSLVSLTALLLLASGGGAGYTGYHYLKNNIQEGFLLKASYEAQTNAMQAIYLAERAATDSSYTGEMDGLETRVEKAFAAIRNGDSVRNIDPAPASVLANLDAMQKVWDELAPSVSQIISQRTVTDQYSRNLADTQRTARDALAGAKEARNKLDALAPPAQLRSQLTSAVATLEDGQQALSADSGVSSDILRASSSSFAQYVATLARLGQQLPKDPDFIAPLIKSYHDSESVVRLIQKTIDSSTGVSENIPHAKTIWAARERVASSASSLIGSIQALPDSRPMGIMIVGGLGAVTLILSILSMLLMRSITSMRTSMAESQGRHQDSFTASRSKHLKILLDEIEQVGHGKLNTKLTEDHESTKEIAKVLNETFGGFARILDDVKGTIIGLSAATEQTLVTEQNVAQNRGEQDKAYLTISELFADLRHFINQIDDMTFKTQQISDDMGRKVTSGEDAVTQVHDNILELQQETLSIQHRSKHMIESFQVLETIASVVAEVAARAQNLSFNANLLADELQDKDQSNRIGAAAKAMGRLAEESKDAVVQIKVQLRTMNDAARDNQEAVDRAGRETDKLRDRSNAAQSALKAIKELAMDLTQGVLRAIDETKLLKEKSGDVGEIMESVNQYSADNSAASEQTAVAIQGVNRQAQELQSTIALFSKD